MVSSGAEQGFETGGGWGMGGGGRKAVVVAPTACSAMETGLWRVRGGDRTRPCGGHACVQVGRT